MKDNLGEILFSFLEILVGVYIIWSTSRKPVVKPLFSITYGGYLSGVCFIIIGVIAIVKVVLE